jgi:hypothetical protein
MDRRTLFVSAVALFAAASCVIAAEGEAFLEPAEAGPDYAIQGEYRGKADDGEGLGAQVIALGSGTFQVVFYPGGLPGKGWDGKNRVRLDGKTQGSQTEFGTASTGWSGIIADGRLVGHSDQGEKFNLKRVERKSPTLGKKPPRHAVVLFDGTNADAWVNGKMTNDGLLRVGTATKEKWGDATMHLEFRTPFMPKARGQGRGNSGVFVQERYELQILDSFGLEGKNNECGGLYSFKAPDVNMCYPPLLWQTYDIDIESARFDPSGKKVKNAIITVRHNGVVIHDRVELQGPLPAGKPETPEPGGISIQNHGNPVLIRNVWIVPKTARDDKDEKE